jgi:enoyl-CoA hydratase/carnithine racemase
MQYAPAGIDMQALQRVIATMDDGVLTLWLNRPDDGNAIDSRMSREMAMLLDSVGADETVRVVVLRGAGAHFCRGLDSRDMAGAPVVDTALQDRSPDLSDSWRTHGLRQLPQPVIAMVHGDCLGGALAILASCDIVLAASDAAFATCGPLESARPSALAEKSLPQVMTHRAARYFLLTGDRFNGEEAERNGLATHSVPQAELESSTYELGRELAAKDPLALRFTKDTLEHAPSMTWDAVLSYTAAKFAQLKSLQAGRPSTRAAAVESFLAGKSKPGLGG